jgi:hypothetical protein
MTSENTAAVARKRFSRRRLGIVVAGIIVICSVAYVHGVRRVSPKAIELLINRNLQPGARPDDVIAFLNAQHIAHSGYIPESKKIYADIGRSSIGLATGRINIVFTFDEDGKLISHNLRELFDFL